MNKDSVEHIDSIIEKLLYNKDFTKVREVLDTHKTVYPNYIKYLHFVEEMEKYERIRQQI